MDKKERNEAMDTFKGFQRFRTRNFRMRVPLPYCNSGIGRFLFWGQYALSVLEFSIFSVEQPPPRHRLIIPSI